MAFFSIILPTYNRAHLISRAIESVLAQSFADWELIVIDDGSRDDTFERIRRIINGDARIRYHFSRNRGLAAARNLGCSMATGMYYTFLDSDDAYLPEHLQRRYELLLNGDIELLHGGVEVIGDPYVSDTFDPSKRIPVSECVVGGTFFVRNDLWSRLGGFNDIAYGDDNEFFQRAQSIGALIEKTDLPTYTYYRTESDSLCAIVEREGIEGIARFRART